jgi:heat shock protein HtpX
MKRIVLLIATNVAIMLVLSIVVSVFGFDRYLTRQGLDLQALLAFSAVLGFGGAFISLLLSKWMAKRAMGVQVITEPRTEAEQWLVNTVRQQAETAGIGMPEVGVFNSPEPNAFATGANKNSALVAVSSGLLSNMRRNEVEAVLGHEVSHVANGDMVTLTLIQV